MPDPLAAAQPSWADGGKTIGAAPRGRLGPPAVLAGLVYIVIVDSLVIIAVLVGAAFVPKARGGCNADGSFCFTDPVPTIDANRMAIVVFAVGLTVSMIVCIVLRRAVVVVVLIQTVLLAVVLTHDLSTLHRAEHRQDLLRACNYGADGHCPGIVNLTRDP